MQRANPKYVLRNHLAQNGDPSARSKATFAKSQRLLKVLERPYDEQPEHTKPMPASRPTGPPTSKSAAHHDPRPPTTHDDREGQKTDAEWRAQLDPMQFEVTRHAATERPFTGKYWDHWDDGSYHCVCCGAPLFDSTTKFDAGCGWPSFCEADPGEVIERISDASHGMVRVEVRCKNAARTWATCSPTGPSRPASATA